jgi:hypothetical protein
MTYSIVISKILSIGKTINTIFVNDDDTKYADIKDIIPHEDNVNFKVDITKLKDR